MSDASQKKVGVSFGDGRTIRDVADLEAFCHEERVDIAIISVPAHAAQSIIDRLVGLDPGRRVSAILNFAPVRSLPARRRGAPGRLSSEPCSVVLPRPRGLTVMDDGTIRHAPRAVAGALRAGPAPPLRTG